MRSNNMSGNKMTLAVLAALLLASMTASAQTSPGNGQNTGQQNTGLTPAQLRAQNQAQINAQIDRNERHDLYYLYEGPPYLVTQSYAVPQAPPATAPLAYARSFTVGRDGSLSGNLFYNNGTDVDLDPNGYVTSFVPEQSVTAHGGSLQVSNNGLFTYTPPPGFQGNDSFTYTLVNGAGLSSTAVVTVAVTAN